jgi:hypothetical protein
MQRPHPTASILLKHNSAPAAFLEADVIAVDIDQWRARGGSRLKCIKDRVAVLFPDLIHTEEFVPNEGRGRIGKGRQNIEVEFPNPAPTGLEIAPLTSIEVSGIVGVCSVTEREKRHFPVPHFRLRCRRSWKRGHQYTWQETGADNTRKIESG